MAEKTKKVILKRSEHIVSRKKIDDEAIKVMRRLQQHGFDALLVGGGVRDLLLGETPKDFDVVTDAHPGQIRKIFRNSRLIGRRFRLVHIMFRGKIIEVSTYRRDIDEKPEKKEDGDLYRRRDNSFGTQEEDAFRRDFTINALYYDARSFDVIDYVGGVRDIKNKVIKCIGEPDIRFKEDPVRMLRAIRFAARLGFSIDKDTYAGILRNYKEIKKASPFRLLEEIYKLFLFGKSEPTFRLLKECKLMSIMLPELDEFTSEIKEGENSVWSFLAALDDGLTTVSRIRAALLLAVLYYGPFKKHLKEQHKKNSKVLYEDVAAEVISELTSIYRVPKKIYYHIIHIFTMQRYFQSNSKYRISPNKLVAREYFPEALALFELDVKVSHGDTKLLHTWMERYTEYKSSISYTERNEKKYERRKKYRRRKKRKKIVKNTTGKTEN